MLSYFIALAGTCFVLMIAGLIVEYGLLDGFKVVRDLRMATSTAFKLANTLVGSLSNKTVVNVVRTRSGKALSVNYTVGGRPAIMHIPYQSERFMKMKDWRVCLAYEDRNRNPVNITQDYCVPYMCTAEMLGGDRIVAENVVTKQIMVFDKKVVPNFNLD